MSFHPTKDSPFCRHAPVIKVVNSGKTPVFIGQPPQLRAGPRLWVVFEGDDDTGDSGSSVEFPIDLAPGDGFESFMLAHFLAGGLLDKGLNGPVQLTVVVIDRGGIRFYGEPFTFNTAAPWT